MPTNTRDIDAIFSCIEDLAKRKHKTVTNWLNAIDMKRSTWTSKKNRRSLGIDELIEHARYFNVHASTIVGGERVRELETKLLRCMERLEENK